jgi:ryanodine receptor 2
MSYVPKPIDTSRAQLSDELLALAEKLAEHTHDVWARQRIADGWSWGPRRNDDKKETPLLVPYGDLPESEKDYDRTMSIEVLKSVIALGFRIERGPDGVADV